MSEVKSVVEMLKRMPVEVRMVLSRKYLKPEQSDMEIAVRGELRGKLNLSVFFCAVIEVLISISVIFYLGPSSGNASVWYSIMALIVSIFTVCVWVSKCSQGREIYLLRPFTNLFWGENALFGKYIKDGPISFEALKRETDERLSDLAENILSKEKYALEVKDLICQDPTEVKNVAAALEQAREKYRAWMGVLKDLGLHDGDETESYTDARERINKK